MIQKTKDRNGHIRFDVFGYGTNDDNIGMLMLTITELEQLKADIEAELWDLEVNKNPSLTESMAK